MENLMSETTVFPQYAKTNHPDVIQALMVTDQRRSAFLERVRLVSEKYTTGAHNGYINGWHHDQMWMVGVKHSALKDDVPGNWKKPTKGVTRPYSKNPADKDFRLSYKAEKIPGRGNVLRGMGRMGPGALFLLDGYVYSYLNFIPLRAEEEAGDYKAYGWEEILPSEAQKALDAYNAQADEEDEA